jgi:ABC-type uncharacterized transport system substrate-binding protein
MAAATILAVAIGEPTKSRTITNMTQLNGVRPYIIGLITYLSQQTVPNSNPQRKYTLGTDYSIDYQECYEDDETFTGAPDVIFGMSTPVVRQAMAFTSTIPIVGIFSDHVGEHFNQTQNICGVNAQRIQIADQYYDKFVQTLPKGTNVYVLHRVGNTASTKSLAKIRTTGANPAVLKVMLAPGHDIQTLINGVPTNSGLLVLPVDHFFGAADDINRIATTKSLPVFWPVTDWVPSGISGYGAAQETCGEYMGKQVQYILEHPKQIPQGAARFVTVPPADRRWVTSEAVAKALNIKLKKHKGLHFV